MEKKTASVIMLALLSISMSALAFNVQPVRTGFATYTVHNLDTGLDYSTIQEAIDAPETLDGHTLLVDAGTYYEHVTVNKSLNLQGENRDTTIIDGSGSGHVVYITANWVNITGFTVRNGARGIYVDGSSNNSISGNNITNNEHGILLLFPSSGNIISGNNVTNNYHGIYVDESSNNSISGNNITNNNYYGIALVLSSNNVLRNNRMADNLYNINVWGLRLSDFLNDVDASNTVDGKPVCYWISRRDEAIPLDAGYVVLINCTNITVQNLRLTKCEQGVLLAYTTDSTITKNNIANNDLGIQLFNSSGNSISGNNITNNNLGVHLYESSSNTISGNTITNNNLGVYLRTSRYNVIFHNNFIDNTKQVKIVTSGYANVWDDGYPSGGNYWSDYTGVDEKSGPNQDQFGSDGIGDTSYIIDNYNIDHYPLISPFPQTPDFDIVASPSTGTIAQGTIVTTNVYVSNIAGYDNLVSLFASGQPEGVIIDFNPNAGTPYFTSTMTVQVGDSVPLDTYTITVTGLGSDGKTHSTTYTLTVALPDFEIGVFPSTGTIAQGTTVTTNVYVYSIAGYDYLVSLSASGQPEGITINFNPNAGTPYFTSTMTIQVGDSVPLDTYTITVTGLGSDGKTHSTTYMLTVIPAGVPEFPLGVEVATVIGLMAAVVYIWTRKRKTKPTIPKRFTT